MRLALRPLVAATAILLSSAAALADLVQLKDGRFVEGVPAAVDGTNLVLKFKNGEVKVPLALVESYFIEGQVPPAPETEEGRAKAAQGLVPWKGKWLKPADRDKAMKAELAARRADLEEAKKHSQWRDRYKFTSKYFTFESTLPKSMNEQYSQLMDAFFEAFKKDWGLGSPPKDFEPKLKVCFYSTYEDFQNIGGAPGALAYYRFVAPRELNFFNARTDPRQTTTVMFHEATHYLEDYHSYPFNSPHCMGEGMAEYYGASTWDPKTKTLKTGEIQEGRLAEVKSDIDTGRFYSLTEYLDADSRDYEDYYWGWSFWHFMMSTPAYQKKFKAFFVDLAKGRGVERRPTGQGALVAVSTDEFVRVFKDKLGIKDLAALEKEWHEYVKNLDAPTVRGYEQAGKRAYGEGRVKFRAPRLLKKAVEMGSRDRDTMLCYARCLRRKGEMEQALGLVDKAIEVDPLDAELWSERSYLLRANGDAEGAKQTLALARELDPDAAFFDMEDLAEKLGGGGDGD
jgi:tetratricopeptide (TPR) repeat protein